MKTIIAVIAVAGLALVGTKAWGQQNEDQTASRQMVEENQALKHKLAKAEAELQQLREKLKEVQRNQEGAQLHKEQELRATREQMKLLQEMNEKLAQKLNKLESSPARGPVTTGTGEAPASTPAASETPLLGADATVSGRTLQVTMGVPGALMGKPGKPIPPHPVGTSSVRFSGGGKDYEVMSGKDGSYKIKLPPGTYKVTFKAPGQPQWHPRNEAEVKTIEVRSGENLKIDIPVLTLAVD